jgi:hypothetical protein
MVMSMSGCITLAWSQIFPFIPIVSYLVLCLATPSRQRQGIPDRRYEVLSDRMTTNLEFVGLSFAVVGLIVPLFQQNLSTVYQSIFLFSLSLACFFASYVLLYLRLWRAFDTLSEGLTNNGLWTVIAGLRSLFVAFNELRPISVLFSALLWLLAVYIALDLIFKWKDRKRSD